MVASSAAMALPTRPASIVAASTGPSSRTTEMLMIAAEPRRQAHLVELLIRLHGQHHADEHAGDGHHRHAADADGVQGRQQGAANGRVRAIQPTICAANRLTSPSATRLA